MHHVSRTEQRKRSLRLAPEEDPEFQIAPMIDILLVLLVFFMSISSTEVLQVNKEILLPVAKDAKDKDKAGVPGQAIINVVWNEINRQGGIQLDENPFTPDELVSELQGRLSKNPMMRVLIRSDKRVEYAYLREIMKACGDAAVQNVTFSVVDKEVPTTPAP
jgi:biopolymer transport protein ExbD